MRIQTSMWLLHELSPDVGDVSVETEVPMQ